MLTTRCRGSRCWRIVAIVVFPLPDAPPTPMMIGHMFDTSPRKTDPERDARRTVGRSVSSSTTSLSIDASRSSRPRVCAATCRPSSDGAATISAGAPTAARTGDGGATRPAAADSAAERGETPTSLVDRLPAAPLALAPPALTLLPVAPDAHPECSVLELAPSTALVSPAFATDPERSPSVRGCRPTANPAAKQPTERATSPTPAAAIIEEDPDADILAPSERASERTEREAKCR